MSKEIIGIIGTIRSGKDTVGEYIAKKFGIPVYQISFPLKEICRESGIDPVRENLIALGTRLAKEHGDGYLAEYLLQHSPERFIITGMRQLGQIAVLKTSSKFLLISVDADPQLRFERGELDPKPGEASSIEEFIDRETAENSPPNAQRLFECMAMADYHISNEGSLEELYVKVDSILSQTESFQF